MLARWERVRPVLACPACRGELVDDAGGALRCRGAGCRLAAAGPFDAVRSQPVLVDWDESILSRDEVLQSGAAPVVPFRQSRLKTWIKDRALRPGAVGRARGNADAFLRRLAGGPGTPLLLMVGGGTQGIGTDALYDSAEVDVLAFDVYASERTHLVADAHAIPLRDGSVDAVWIQYVLEHVLDPWRVAAEIHRVLRHGGLVYAETPFLQHVHADAYDFTRFTHSGHRWLFRDFEELDSGVGMGPGVQLLWTVEHLARGVARSRAAGKAAKLAASAAQVVERVIPERYQRDSASSFYFVGRKSAARLKPRDMVDYYRRGRA